jgi:hypothetical protein
MVKVERILDQSYLDRSVKIWKGTEIFVVVWLSGSALFVVFNILFNS